MKRIRPRLLTAEIMLWVIRLAVRTTTGVWPFGRIGAPDLVLIGDPGLVAPVDRGPLGLGPLGDRRVVLLQPGRDRRRRALPGPGQGLLRGHAPALQVELHRRQAERLAEPQRDQVAHRPAGPQGERQLELVGGPVADPALDLARLLGRQAAPCRGAATPAARPARRHRPARGSAAARCSRSAAAHPRPRPPRAWLNPCCRISTSARRRSSSCAARPMLRKSRASMPKA